MSNKVLIIDDDLYLRELYEEVLKKEGYEVETASDGKEGYEKIIAQPYDAILLDIMLPQLDGLGILTKLKETKSQVPFKNIILLTNLSHDATVKQALALGVHACLTKSAVTPDQIVVKVKEVLGLPAKPAAAAQPTPAAPATKAAPSPEPAQPVAPAKAA